MRIDVKLGERRRKGDGWTRKDVVLVDGKPIRGHIVTQGRRKCADQTVTLFGSDSKSGSDPYWLAARNGLKTEEQ